jgi:phosphatidyl-myo-inositol dimannoside synthase
MKHARRAATGPPRRRPRLLIITPDFPPDHGGVQTLVYGLARAITRFDVEVVTIDRPGAARFDAASGLRTRRVARRVSHGKRQIVALNAAALERGVRFRPDVTLSAHAVTSPAATVIRRLLRARTGQYFYAKEILHRPHLSAFAARRADTVVAVSAYTASLIAATGVSPVNLHVIPPGIELPQDPDSLPADRPTVLTIAQARDRYKGHDVLIEALADVRWRVPDVEWVVIGDGPLRPELEQRAQARGLGRTARFLGQVCDDERNEWLRRANVLAMPSRLHGEGFGIVLFEAAAYGKPVVAGNVGGSCEAVQHGVTGLLVDPTDPAAVGGAITSLLLDADRARLLGAQAAEWVQGFTWHAIAARVEHALLCDLERTCP